MLDKSALLLSKEVEKALEKTFCNLCENGEHFYYCTLTTSGDGGMPAFSAWSKEALLKMEDDELKWSYADSPYCLYKYDEYWKVVEDMWWKRPHIHNLPYEQYVEEFTVRIEILVLAMKNLDNAGFFGLNQKRDDIFINVELAPPDKTNTERAQLLNPSTSVILKEWLVEMAE